jgi:hypothetical protein
MKARHHLLTILLAGLLSVLLLAGQPAALCSKAFGSVRPRSRPCGWTTA